MIMCMGAFTQMLSTYGEARRLDAGSYLFHAGDLVDHIHLIATGGVSLERLQTSGTVTCFQRAGPGAILAEASLYSERYHCDARVTAGCQVYRMAKRDVLARIDADPTLARDWAAYLARAVQHARLTAEIRGLKTVGARLDAWLDAFGPLPAKGEWMQLAHELAVSREALYRELAARRQG